MANEKRLIDANALVKIAEKRCGVVNIKHIDECPTVDAVEVVHARWEQIGYDEAMDRITCSHCKEYFNIIDNCTEEFNYCPNCGAKMDLKGE